MLLLYKVSQLILVLACLGFSTAVMAQSNADAADEEQHISDALWQTVEQSYQQAIDTVESEDSLYLVSKLLGQNCPEGYMPSNELAAYLSEEAEYWDESYGLQLRGGLTSGDIEESEFDAGGTSYLELSWDVLGRGYFENQYKSNRFSRLSEVESIKVELEKQRNHFRCRDAIITASFSRPEFTLSAELLNIMELVQGVEEKAYLTGNSTLDELFLSEESIVKLRQKLKLLHLLQGEKLPAFSNPPLIDLNISEILRRSESDGRLDKLAALEIENAADSNPYQNNSRLRFFIRKELDVLASQQDDLVAGLRFIYPLNFGERASETRKVNVLSNELKLQQWEKTTRIKEAYLGFDQQLERATTQSYRYLRAKERMRRVFAKRQLGKSLRISAVVARLKTFLEAAIELVEVKKTVFQRANEVLRIARVDYSPELMSVHPVSVVRNRARFGERSSYLWSSEFNAMSNDSILLLLETKGISKIAVSASSKVDADKLRAFIAKADVKGLAVELLLGDASWVREENSQAVLDKIDVASAMHPEIHLDIEPHTLENYQGNEKAYQQQLVQLAERAAEQDPTMTLSLSLPFHYTQRTYQSVSKVADNLFVMMYGNTSIGTTVRRLTRILEVVPIDKVVVTLRLDDFENEYHMERFIKAVSQATGIQRFAIHPLDAFVKEGDR